MGKLIAICGPAGTGKTTLSYTIGDKLANNSSLVLIVHTNFTMPTVNLFVPEAEHNQSLGRLLMTGDYTHSENTYIPYPKNKNMFVSGIVKNENFETYPEVKPQSANKYFDIVTELYDYVIADCSDTVTDTLALVAIGRADRIIEMITPNAKGIVFKSAYDKIMTGLNSPKKTLYAAALTKNYSNVTTTAKLLNVKFTAEIPYSEEADYKTMCGETVKGCSTRAGAKYEYAVSQLCRMVA